MYSDSKKIQLIEEVLRLDNNSVLREVESILKRSRKSGLKTSGSAYDLLGLWSKRDSELIEKAIEEGCEKIYLDDWK